MRSIVSDTVATSCVLAVRVLAQAITLLLVARMLGPEQFGQLAGLSAIAIILGTAAPLGTNFIVLRDISISASSRAHTLSYAIPTTLTTSALLLLAFFAAASAISRSSSSIMAWTLIGAAEIWLQPLVQLAASEHHARGRIVYSQVVTTLPLICRAIATIAAWWLEVADPLSTYACAYIASTVIGLAIATTTLQEAWPKPSAWRSPSLTELKSASGFAALSVTRLGPLELDKALALALLSLTAAGNYSASARVVGASVIPVFALMLAALPRLFRQSNPTHRETFHARLIAVSTAYGAAMAAALFFAAPLIQSAFGEGFGGIEDALRWLCIGIPALAIRIASGNILMASGTPWRRVLIECLGMATLIGCAVVFTRGGSAAGMPLAIVTAEWAMAVIGIAAIHRLHSDRGRS